MGTSYSHANEVKLPDNEFEKFENVTIKISNIPSLITNFNDSRLHIELFDCTVEFEITIWIPGAVGPTRIKGKITVKGKSCFELLKESLR